MLMSIKSLVTCSCSLKGLRLVDPHEYNLWPYLLPRPFTHSFPRTIHLWNKLLACLTSCNSVSSFVGYIFELAMAICVTFAVCVNFILCVNFFPSVVVYKHFSAVVVPWMLLGLCLNSSGCFSFFMSHFILSKIFHSSLCLCGDHSCWYCNGGSELLPHLLCQWSKLSQPHLHLPLVQWEQ